MSGRYSKSQFFGITKDLNGVDSLDIADFDFDDFINFIRPKTVQQHVISEDERHTPDLVSYNYYQTHDLYWLILMVNRMVNPFIEFVPGKTIIIPYLSDIEEFVNTKNLTSSKGVEVVLS